MLRFSLPLSSVRVSYFSVFLSDSARNRSLSGSTSASHSSSLASFYSLRRLAYDETLLRLLLVTTFTLGFASFAFLRL
jgi:hypothetical protein